MLHENLNVLEYAAISTNLKPLNPNVNRSIMKSANQKRLKPQQKSCLKKK
jgi:hypothetical protein